MSTVDPTPFLPSTTPPETTAATVRSAGLRQAARMIRRASTGRRAMREPSLTVRETAAQEIEDRQIDWAHSRPVVVLDGAWNIAFIVAAVAALLFTRDDSVRLPLRLWIVGYAVQCLVHVVCVCAEFGRRQRRGNSIGGGVNGGDDFTEDSSALLRHLESANMMFSFIWWMIGFYWIFLDGHALQQDSPMLYWLCIAFLILDLFFVIFCVALASVIAAAVCCCLPCIIAILYVLADRAGASKEDIELLSKYTFHRFGGEEKIHEESRASCGGVMRECGTDSPSERRLTAEDAECCICLSAYDDGVELRELPCGHHFHCPCVEKWLYINSTCPLCKYDISRHSSGDGDV